MDTTLSVIKSISDKNRLRILSVLLVHNELCACQITEFLGVAGATASRHLGLMVNAGILKNRKQGRWIYFRINTEEQSLTDLLGWVKNRIDKSEQLKEDLDALKRILLIPCENLSQKQRESGTCANSKKKGKHEMKEKLKILFLCTGNSCRSQMAEGWTRELKGDIIDAYSAGVETHGLNPNAVKVMAEAGVDISGQQSKLINDFMDMELDAVITVCGHANETCPYFPPRCKVIHVGFNDPPKMVKELAEQGADEEQQLDCYRKIRDEIKAFVENLPENINNRIV